jgi:rubrerythrin
MAEGMLSEVALVAELNDLLQLDHDAVQAYNLALALLRSDAYKQPIRRFKADHERHIEALSGLIRRHGGVPIQLPHLPTGPAKLAVQAAGKAGGDSGLLLAFKANERQGRDDYRRAANREHSADVGGMLNRAAEDESTHYSWVVETLDELGLGSDSTAGKLEAAFEIGHTKMADAIEGVEKQTMAVAEGARRGLKGQWTNSPMRTLLIAAGAGLVAGALMRRDR